MRQVAVFNTNVMFSATGWRGSPFLCLELARSGAVEGITCWELLDELTEKLQTKLRFTSAQADDTVIDLLSFLRLVHITGQLKAVLSDPDDDKTIESAVVAQASHIVTGDRRHLLPLRTFQGVSIVTPAEFLAIVSAP